MIRKKLQKLLAISVVTVIMYNQNNLVAMNYNAGILSVLTEDQHSQFESVLKIVNEKLIQNINTKAEASGLGNEYWAKKAALKAFPELNTDNKNNFSTFNKNTSKKISAVDSDKAEKDFSESIKNLGILLTLSYIVGEKQYDEIIKSFKNGVEKSLWDLKAKISKKIENDQGIDKDNIGKYLINKYKKPLQQYGSKILGLINSWMVFDGLFNNWETNDSDKVIGVCKTNTTFYKTFESVFSRRSDMIRCAYRYRNYKNKDKYESIFASLQKILLSIGRNEVLSGTALWSTILEYLTPANPENRKTDNKKSDGFDMFSHDWKCYLEQFWVSCPGSDNKNNIVTSVMLKTFNGIKAAESKNSVKDDENIGDLNGDPKAEDLDVTNRVLYNFQNAGLGNEEIIFTENQDGFSPSNNQHRENNIQYNDEIIHPIYKIMNENSNNQDRNQNQNIYENNTNMRQNYNGNFANYNNINQNLNNQMNGFIDNNRYLQNQNNLNQGMPNQNQFYPQNNMYSGNNMWTQNNNTINNQANYNNMNMGYNINLANSVPPNQYEQPQHKQDAKLPLLTKKVIVNNQSYALGEYQAKGLNNIGATCFMDSTLQCFLHTKLLTNYFLDESNLSKIQESLTNNKISIDQNSLVLQYINLTKAIWATERTQTVYEPRAFQKLVEKQNPLFVLGQAGDAKDLIIFLLEQMHRELKKKVSFNFPPIANTPLNQYNCKNSWWNFFKDFCKESSQISDVFYGFNETTNVCQYCKNKYNGRKVQNPICYNYGIFNCIISPLNEVRQYRDKKLFEATYQDRWAFCNAYGREANKDDFSLVNKDNVTLDDCFAYNQKTELFTGENSNYCNLCRQLADSHYTSKIFSAPKVLILILNRGRGNIYNIKLNFEKELDITRYVISPCENRTDKRWKYKLFGVITHLGESGPNAHFVASCKLPNNDKWYRYNDAIVYPINNFQKEVHDFGTPYVLFYELMEN